MLGVNLCHFRKPHVIADSNSYFTKSCKKINLNGLLVKTAITENSAQQQTQDFSLYMFPSWLADFQETGLLILESEFFLEHQYQTDEPGKKKSHQGDKFDFKCE